MHILNNISELLLGYREGSDKDILDRIEYLVQLEKDYQMSKNRDEIVMKLDELRELINED